jgi:hypothetical protein
MDTAIKPSKQAGARTHVEHTDPVDHQKHGDLSHIQGWGADRRPEDRPGYPKERTPPRLPDPNPPSPKPQHSHVEVFHSIERPGLTPVYGTTAPPRGLSGKLRGLAFRYSENDLRHWLVLMAADRVDVGEGLLEDLARGHVPNVWREMGGPAEWKHNRAGFMKKAAVGAAAFGVAWYLLRRRR